LIGSVPFAYAVPYSAVVVAPGYGSYKYSKRILSFWKLSTKGDENSSSAIYAKGGLAIYLLYVVALIVRSAINFIFIGSEKFYFNNQEAIENGSSSAILIMPPLIHTGSATTILAFIVTDFLLMVGAGLLIGRNARVLKYYYEYKKRATYEKK
jgi:hypothetical protein